MEEVKLVTLGDLQDACIEALKRLNAEGVYLFTNGNDEDKLVTAVLKGLFSYLASRQQAVLYLWSADYVWDAEMILRAYYETAAKVIYICFTDAARKSAVVNEFAIELGAICDRRLGVRAVHHQQMSAPGSVPSEIMAMLQDEDRYRADIEGNKAYRKKLEQKWSFTELMGLLDRGEGCLRLIGAKALLHGYGIASHLIHADQIALDLMRDRAERDPGVRRLLEMAQSQRILGDLVNIGFLCVGALRVHYDGLFADEAALRAAMDLFNAIGKPFQKAFEDSQAGFYEAWRESQAGTGKEEEAV